MLYNSSGGISALKEPETYIEILKQIKAKQGVYAVYGNRDDKRNAGKANQQVVPRFGDGLRRGG